MAHICSSRTVNLWTECSLRTVNLWTEIVLLAFVICESVEQKMWSSTEKNNISVSCICVLFLNIICIKSANNDCAYGTLYTGLRFVFESNSKMELLLYIKVLLIFFFSDSYSAVNIESDYSLIDYLTGRCVSSRKILID